MFTLQLQILLFFGYCCCPGPRSETLNSRNNQPKKVVNISALLTEIFPKDQIDSISSSKNIVFTRLQRESETLSIDLSQIVKLFNHYSVVLLSIDYLRETTQSFLDTDLLICLSTDSDSGNLSELNQVLTDHDKFRIDVSLLLLTSTCNSTENGLETLNNSYSYAIVDFTLQLCKITKRKSTHGSLLKISAFECPPYLTSNVDPIYSSVRDAHDGLEYRIFKELRKRNNWTLSYELFNSSSYPSFYTEVIQSVANRRADVGMCSQWITVVSNRSLDISFPYSDACLTFLVPKPKQLPKLTFVFQPLQFALWVLWFIISLVFLPLIMHRITALSYIQCLLDVVRLVALTSLTYRQLYSSNAQRILLCSWCITYLLLSTGYVTGFTSLLTLPRYTRSIDTLEDMIAEGIKWGGPNWGSLDNVIDTQRHGVDGLMKNYRVFNKSEYNRLIRTLDYAIYGKVLRGYLEETDGLDEFARTHLKVLDTCLLHSPVVFLLQKNSPFKQRIDRWLRRFVESGLVNHWHARARWPHRFMYMDNFYTNDVQATDEERARTRFTVENLQGAFYLLLMGYFLGFCALQLEFLHVYRE